MIKLIVFSNCSIFNKKIILSTCNSTEISSKIYHHIFNYL